MPFPAQRFTSTWKATKGDWAYVDLGAVADIEEVRLHWLYEGMQGVLEVSDDTRNWKPYAGTQENSKVQSIKAKAKAPIRF